MTTVFSVANSHGFRTKTYCRNQPNKTRLALYKPLLSLLKVYVSNKTVHFSLKVGVACMYQGVEVCMFMFSTVYYV